MEHVPVLCIGDLSANERKAYALADNKIALNAGWDQELLALELQDLIELDFNLELTGFSLAEIDFTLDAAREASLDASDEPADRFPRVEAAAVTQRGDLWQLGDHRLLCGDARSAEDHATLMEGTVADVVFTDPPYNMPIDGNVYGLGSVRHREFAMGAGEMSATEFTGFLALALESMLPHLGNGTICMCAWTGVTCASCSMQASIRTLS